MCVCVCVLLHLLNEVGVVGDIIMTMKHFLSLEPDWRKEDSRKERQRFNILWQQQQLKRTSTGDSLLSSICLPHQLGLSFPRVLLSPVLSFLSTHVFAFFPPFYCLLSCPSVPHSHHMAGKFGRGLNLPNYKLIASRLVPRPTGRRKWPCTLALRLEVTKGVCAYTKR